MSILCLCGDSKGDVGVGMVWLNSILWVLNLLDVIGLRGYLEGCFCSLWVILNVIVLRYCK